jgi:hypothetical protein
MRGVMSGKRPDVRENVQEGLISDDFWMLMAYCCDPKQHARPTAQTLVNNLQQIVDGISLVH